VLKKTGGSRKFIILLLVSVLGSTTLMAEPAYWFRWESKLNGKMICRQLSPGEGWQQHAGPFYDAQCRNLVPKIGAASI